MTSNAEELFVAGSVNGIEVENVSSKYVIFIFSGKCYYIGGISNTRTRHGTAGNSHRSSVCRCCIIRSGNNFGIESASIVYCCR